MSGMDWIILFGVLKNALINFHLKNIPKNSGHALREITSLDLMVAQAFHKG